LQKLELCAASECKQDGLALRRAFRSYGSMDSAPFVWLNDRLLPAQEARISPFDHGLLVGDGVFETLVARQGRPFAAHEHYERLVRSCSIMGLRPVSEAEYLQAMEAVLQANAVTEGRIRVTLTSGDGPLGSDRGSEKGTFIVVTSPLPAHKPAEKVCLAPWPRNERGALASVKSVSYAENVLALAHAKARGCGEALLANTAGELCEGTGSNIFVVAGGCLLTPPLASGCLAGVTRLLTLKACTQAGIPCSEEPMPASVLAVCEEAFLTSTTRDVHPIAEADGRTLPAPGPVTAAVMAAFKSFSGLSG
jgi:branched-chain amino acid aminotransferase